APTAIGVLMRGKPRQPTSDERRERTVASLFDEGKGADGDGGGQGGGGELADPVAIGGALGEEGGAGGLVGALETIAIDNHAKMARGYLCCLEGAGGPSPGALSRLFSRRSASSGRTARSLGRLTAVLVAIRCSSDSALMVCP